MNNKFSENLKKIRKYNNLSQEQLADELGVSRQAISKWESAIAYPEMDKIITLCEKFDLNIDDFLHKDITEVKGEEESKKNLNKYVDDFLSFITNTINMFSNMSFKSKIKCLFEQMVIGGILLVVCLLIGLLGEELLYTIYDIIPDKLYYILYSIIHFAYIVFAITSSVVIIVHIFKTRYIDYYEKIKKEVIEKQEIEINDELENVNKEEKIDKKNKILFKQNEDKIIIRDPKHSEYKFINGLFKVIIGVIKFFTLCSSLIFFVSLISLFIALVISFLIIKTGVFFVGLLIAILSSSVINIILILFLLNFIFNRKNDKKKMIWTFIISLISLGIGVGLILIGTLNFEYIENDKSILKTENMEIDMKNDLIFDIYPNAEYIESPNKNIKIEYTINKYCEMKQTNMQGNIFHMWPDCNDPFAVAKEVIKKINEKQIISINNEPQNVKIFTTKENIEILKKNYKNYFDYEKQAQNIINDYEIRIFELQEKINKYAQKEWEYEEEIKSLKNEISDLLSEK